MYNNYHSIFQFPHLRKSLDKNDNLLFVIEKAEKNKSFWKLFKDKFIFLIPNKFIFTFFKSSADILFHADRFPDVIKDQNTYKVENFSNIIVPYFNFIYFEKSNFLSRILIKKIIYLYYADPLLNGKQAKNLIKDTVTWMIKCKFKYIVVQNDWLFIERFLIFCAKESNITSICIQDGLLSKKTITKANQKYVDYIFTWDSTQANLNRLRGFENKYIKILGYPHNIISTNQFTHGKKICILGQHFEVFNTEIGFYKKQLLTELVFKLKPKFKNIMYKQHPGEKDKNFLPENIDIFSGSFSDALEQFDIFIALTSTTLLEATLANKIAIQLYDDMFNGDNMQDSGYAYTVKSTDINHISDYIMSLESSFLSSCSVPFSKKVSQKFVSLLKDIENEKG